MLLVCWRRSNIPQMTSAHTVYLWLLLQLVWLKLFILCCNTLNTLHRHCLMCASSILFWLGDVKPLETASVPKYYGIWLTSAVHVVFHVMKMFRGAFQKLLFVLKLIWISKECENRFEPPLFMFIYFDHSWLSDKENLWINGPQDR